MDGTKQYPGGSATVEQLLLLAGEYRQAAQTLHEKRRRRHPLSLAPCRLSAIHAIELYLNALLKKSGYESEQIRALKHDLAARAELVQQSGLLFRKRTAQHLATLAGNRKYLISRYDPELASTATEINRVMATLEEVSKKAAAHIAQQ